jgi:hypothetical protein
MLSLAAGRFRRLQTRIDARGRDVSIWALPTASQDDAGLSVRVLQAAVPAWEAFTGQQLVELGKFDMLAWNGQSPWSISSMSLLWMDRFRTLWNPRIRCAPTLVLLQAGICARALQRPIDIASLVQAVHTRLRVIKRRSQRSIGSMQRCTASQRHLCDARSARSCSTASDLVRAAHVVCHEAGPNWLGGLVQTLNSTERGFIIESTTSYGESACAAVALPALSNRAIYREMFAPPFRDSRGLHVGALFHALEEFSQPELAGAGVVGTLGGRYAKGAALLAMLEAYVDSVIGPVRATHV